MPAARALDVWMNGEPVGRWELSGADQRFSYRASWLDSKLRRPLSLTMPLRPAGQPYTTKVVQPFFENLLPDSDELRRRMMSRFGTPSTGAFDLLAQVGRDCVGAVQLTPVDAGASDVRGIQSRRLTEAGVARILRRVHTPLQAAQDDDDFRISLAGAQEKTGLLRHEGRWCVPLGTTPSTHIFKLPMISSGSGAPDFSTSVQNEWLCARLVEAFGLEVARSEMETFEDLEVLVVERFDRRPSSDGRWIVRRLMEDFCQATATPPGLKYERHGGPGVSAIMELLKGSAEAGKDRSAFFSTLVVYWLLCAIDGHAKNFSVFIEAGGEYALTPRYDIISAYPVFGRRADQLSPHKVKMAMAISGKNRHYRWREIHLEHWLTTASRAGVLQPRALLETIASSAPGVIAKVEAMVPKGFPSKVAGPIFEGLRSAAGDLLAELAR